MFEHRLPASLLYHPSAPQTSRDNPQIPRRITPPSDSPLSPRSRHRRSEPLAGSDRLTFFVPPYLPRTPGARELTSPRRGYDASQAVSASPWFSPGRPHCVRRTGYRSCCGWTGVSFVRSWRGPSPGPSAARSPRSPAPSPRRDPTPIPGRSAPGDRISQRSQRSFSSLSLEKGWPGRRARTSFARSPEM